MTQTAAPTTTTTLYVHDINNHIIAETNTAGQTLREYIWLNDLPVAVVDNVNTLAGALLRAQRPSGPSGADDRAKPELGLGRDL